MCEVLIKWDKQGKPRGKVIQTVRIQERRAGV